MKRTMVVGAVLWASAARAQLPTILSYTGTIMDGNGAPVADGNFAVAFTFFDSVEGGNALWSGTYTVATFRGVFTALIGTSSEPLDPMLFSRPQVWLAIQVEGDTLAPRLRVAAVPYALLAGSLECPGCVDAGDVARAEVQLRVAGACPAGQAIRAVNEDGTVDCAVPAFVAGPGIDIAGATLSTSFADFVCTGTAKVCGFDAGDPMCCPDQGGGPGGGVTQVDTAPPLTGGPITTTGTISLAPGGITASLIAQGALTREVGTADEQPAAAGTFSIDAIPPDEVLFSRMLDEPGLYLFIVHLDTVVHDGMGGDALGLQLYNVTAGNVADPLPGGLAVSWDYNFVMDMMGMSEKKAISRVLLYDKPTSDPETLQVRAFTDGGVAYVESFDPELFGLSHGMRVVHLRK
jgi:hypothetical protein